MFTCDGKKREREGDAERERERGQREGQRSEDHKSNQIKEGTSQIKPVD
jgi:hypothetical protein